MTVCITIVIWSREYSCIVRATDGRWCLYWMQVVQSTRCKDEFPSQKLVCKLSEISGKPPRCPCSQLVADKLQTSRTNRLFFVWPLSRSRAQRSNSWENGLFQSLSHPLSVHEIKILMVNYDTPINLHLNRTDFSNSSSFGVTWPSNLGCSTFGKQILLLTRSLAAVPYAAYLLEHVVACRRPRSIASDTIRLFN